MKRYLRLNLSEALLDGLKTKGRFIKAQGKFNQAQGQFIKAQGCLLLLITLMFSGLAWSEEEEGAGPTINYHELKPAFVANFGTEASKKLKFLKAEVTVRASSEAAINEVSNHDSLVRHHIVLVLSKQTDKTLSTSKGQESVRKEALEAVKAALTEETGKPQIDDLLFTSFVVQR